MTAFLAKALAMIGTAFSALPNFVKTYMMNWVREKLTGWVKSLWAAVRESFRRSEAEKADKENQQKYEEVTGEQSNPTQEQLDQATDDLLNRRR